MRKLFVFLTALFLGLSAHASSLIMSPTSLFSGTNTDNSSTTYSGVNAFYGGISVSTLTYNAAIFNVGTSSVSIGAPAYIKGSITNDAAGTGNYGEVISSISSGNAAYPTSGQHNDLLQITLTPGEWMVSFGIYSTANGGTVTTCDAGIGTAAGNNTTNISLGDNWLYHTAPTAAADNGASISQYDVKIAANTIYYLKYGCTFTVATPKAAGRISGLRIH